MPVGTGAPADRLGARRQTNCFTRGLLSVRRRRSGHAVLRSPIVFTPPPFTKRIRAGASLDRSVEIRYREQLPCSGHALEHVFTSVFEFNAGARDEVANGA